MPGGPRSDLISARDLDVLEFIARFGVVPRDAVARWAKTGRSATIARERRLRLATLIDVAPAFGELRALLLCTRAGLMASGRPELRPARLTPTSLIHEATVARVAAELERSAGSAISEREILAREHAAGEPIHSCALPRGRSHRPDLILAESSGAPRAIEVELSTKGAERLDTILRSWRRAVVDEQFSSVLYRCAPRVLPHVEAAVRRTRTSDVIGVAPLWGDEPAMAGVL